MKILHIGLLSHFTEGMMYQENCLVEENLKDGHEVIFISDTYQYKKGQLIKGLEEDRVLQNGLRLIRLNYDFIIHDFITNKIQKVKKLIDILQEFKPDSILYHGACGYEIMTVSRYVEKNPQTLFYVDSHEDFNNTAKTFIAKLAYKYIHGFFLKKALRNVRKILYISEETKMYLKSMYKISENKLEYFPLGGKIKTEKQKNDAKKKILYDLKIPENCIILCHSGKLSLEKKTKELVYAFNHVTSEIFHLIIVGSVLKENEDELLKLFSSNCRIHYLGWKSGEDLIEILAGSDLYCQPGTQSATMQCAICCGCAAMVYPYNSYRYLMGEDCFYVKSEEEINRLLVKISENPELLIEMKKASFKRAKEYLDYRKLARRICE